MKPPRLFLPRTLHQMMRHLVHRQLRPHSNHLQADANDSIALILQHPAPVFEAVLYNTFLEARYPKMIRYPKSIDARLNVAWHSPLANDTPAAAHAAQPTFSPAQPDGQPPNGRLKPTQVNSRQGHRQLPNGQLHVPNGQLPNGRLPNGQLPNGLLFERCMSEGERASYEPPPPATTLGVLSEGCCCESCWLLAHTDRSKGKLIHRSCLPSTFGSWVSKLSIAGPSSHVKSSHVTSRSGI